VSIPVPTGRQEGDKKEGLLAGGAGGASFNNFKIDVTT
jgi:hypothetical protein